MQAMRFPCRKPCQFLHWRAFFLIFYHFYFMKYSYFYFKMGLFFVFKLPTVAEILPAFTCAIVRTVIRNVKIKNRSVKF